MLSLRRGLSAAAIAILAIAAAVVLISRASGGKDEAANQSPLCGTSPAGGLSIENLTTMRSDQDFQTLGEVEAASGFKPPEITAPGWSFFYGHSLPPNLGTLPDSDVGGVILYYTCHQTVFQLLVLPEALMTPLVPTHPVSVKVDGHELVRVEDPKRVVLQWREDGRGYSATAVPGEGFDEATIFQVIASLR